MEVEQEICINCKTRIYRGVVVVDEWAHGYGGKYCLDKNGFTATPLTVAQPIFYPKSAVL